CVRRGSIAPIGDIHPCCGHAIRPGALNRDMDRFKQRAVCLGDHCPLDVRAFGSSLGGGGTNINSFLERAKLLPAEQCQKAGEYGYGETAEHSHADNEPILLGMATSGAGRDGCNGKTPDGQRKREITTLALVLTLA